MNTPGRPQRDNHWAQHRGPSPKLSRAARCSLIATAMLAGCTTYVPMVMPTLKCPIPLTLTQSCTKPQTLPEGLSFADLIRNYQADRQSLMLCGLQQESLRASIDACNVQIDQYNEALGRLNGGSGGGTPPAK